MRFIKIFRFDIKNGVLKNKYLFLIPTLITITFCVDFALRTSGIDKSNISISDCFMYIYGGMNNYKPSPDNPFQFPVVWLIIFLGASFSVLTYPLNDIQNFGQQVIYRSKSRVKWWLSKCTWNILSTIIYHSIILIILVLFCLTYDVKFNESINRDIIINVFNFSRNQENELLKGPFLLNVNMIIVSVLLSIALNILQMTFSLFIKPVFSFVAVNTICILSAYQTSSLLIGNYGMVLRSNQFLTHHVNQLYGYFIFPVLIIVSVVVGLIKIKHYDVLNRE